MDRRFVALKATDDQETAVSVFRAEDRSALPVTDTAGVLIGIVTVDDVLDVAEAEATEDIQRIGGIGGARRALHGDRASARMIRKRAGWLTALFLGEMLTATAMGFRARDRASGRARAVRPADHLERRQLRLAGVDARHPRARARRGDAGATGGA